MLECLFCQIFCPMGDQTRYRSYSTGELGKPKLDPDPPDGVFPSASRALVAGFPDRDPDFFLVFFFFPRPPPGAIGPSPGIWGTPPLATVFIIFAAWSKRVTSWFTSVTVVPEPRAILILLEPFKTLGVRRSFGVIE